MATTTAATSASLPIPQTSREVHSNRHLHALGIILLELYLGRSIEADVTAAGDIDYCHVAQSLLVKHHDEADMTPDYYRAVHFCLSPRPSTNMSFSFEDQSFRELYYTGVIRSLEEDLKQKFEIEDNFWEEDDL